jgi:hypothetical protein
MFQGFPALTLMETVQDSVDFPHAKRDTFEYCPSGREPSADYCKRRAHTIEAEVVEHKGHASHGKQYKDRLHEETQASAGNYGPSINSRKFGSSHFRKL